MRRRRARGCLLGRACTIGSARSEVNRTPLRLRSSNYSPSSPSRLRTCRLSAGWVIEQAFHGTGEVELLSHVDEVAKMPQFRHRILSQTLPTNRNGWR